MQVQFHIHMGVNVVLLCGWLSESALAEPPAAAQQQHAEQAKAVAALIASGAVVKLQAEGGKVIALETARTFVHPPLADLAVLEKLPHLRGLTIGGIAGGREGLRRIASLKQLSQLSIAYWELNDDEALAELRGLDKLAVLNLTSAGIDGTGLAHLADLPALQDLAVGGSTFSDEGMAALGKLTRLKRLSISGDAISDDGLAHVADLWQLEQLNYFDRYGQITDRGLAHLARLKRLQDLHLDAVLMTDGTVEQLVRMKQLRNLRLSTGTLSKEGYERLQRELPKTLIYSSQWSDPASDPRRRR
jgi:hypothetical protein